ARGIQIIKELHSVLGTTAGKATDVLHEKHVEIVFLILALDDLLDVGSRAWDRASYAVENHVIDMDHVVFVAQCAEHFELVGNARIRLLVSRAADEAYVGPAAKMGMRIHCSYLRPRIRRMISARKTSRAASN